MSFGMMQTETSSPAQSGRVGPWLVALGAALWGTESLWRIPLNTLFASDVIVFYEHVILVLIALPILIRGRTQITATSRRAWLFLLFSGVAGSAVGTTLFTEALRLGNPTVVNVVLNIQPVFSTALAFLLFGDRLARDFFIWAPLSIVAGMFLSISNLHELNGDVLFSGLQGGTGLALCCALFWGASTVAGRGAMLEMSLWQASALRVLVGLLSMSFIVGLRGKLTAASLWPATAAAHPVQAVLLLLGLAILSGGLPLLFYFEGLRRTRASTAGYFEMMQTLAGVLVTWGYFGHPLHSHQIFAAVILIGAVALVQRAQARIEWTPAIG